MHWCKIIIKNFCTEIKKINAKKTSQSKVIDGVEDKNGIANIFSNKYEELYNSVSYNQEELDKLLNMVNKDIDITCNNSEVQHIHIISSQMVAEAIRHLKASKADGSDNIRSDNIINCTNTFVDHLASLFNGMLVHGFPPESFTISTLVPIPKNKSGDLCDSSNYRAIALSSLLCKVFDWIIIINQTHVLKSSDLQYGFKAESSTVLCSAMVIETVNYYNENNTGVYMLLLDATKAFDRVNYVKLFKILYYKGMCPLVLRLIVNMYVQAAMCIRWEDIISPMFDVSNGVKQGGVLSPLLFNIYIDGMLTNLKNSGTGCYIGSTFAGAFGYADDVTVLAPTLCSLGKLTQICEMYASDFDIKFNAKKSKLMFFNNKIQNNVSVDIAFTMNDRIIDNSIKEKHLGNFICNNIHERCVENSVMDFYRKSNYVLSRFPSVSNKVKSKLHWSYCMDVYGSQLWNFNSKYVQQFYVAWRKVIRKIWNLPYATHNRFIHIINNCLPIDILLQKKCLSFIYSAINSENNTVSNIVNTVLSCKYSVMAENYRYLSSKFKIVQSDWQCKKSDMLAKVYKYSRESIKRQDEVLCSIIHELAYMRYNLEFSPLNSEEIEHMLNFICTK
jgi:hypothetical protein